MKAKDVTFVRKTSHVLSSFLSVKNIIILITLFLIAGCDGFNSPTGPTDPFSGSEAELMVKSTQKATLHAILVVDANAPDLADALRADLNNMKTLVDSIAANTGMALNKRIYSGGNATIARVEQAIRTLTAGPDDVILFYYSGHGGRTARTTTRWPNMYLRNGSGVSALNLHDVFTLLRGKGSRLVLVMGDSCNKNIAISQHAASVLQGVHVRGSQAGYEKLFLEKRAAIIASSSVPGEFSYAIPDGSLFTTQFLTALSRELSDSNPIWSDVMASAVRPITGVQQNPQYMIH